MTPPAATKTTSATTKAPLRTRGYLVDPDVVNDSLNDQARDIRETIPMRQDPGDLEEYIRCWSEDDVIEGTPCKALVVILKTRGCTWAIAGGCTMCGYANESAWKKVSDDQLIAQFRRAWRKYDGEALVKIYTSGSFLDKYEVPQTAQRAILEIIAESNDSVQKVAFEARPDYIHEDSFDHLDGIVAKLEVGIGVESSNLRVLRDSVNKGHGFETFPEAARICHDHNVSVKAYMMAKPPFLKEYDALEDSRKTIAAVAPHADVASLNPTNIQGRTIVDALHRRGSFRAPWLWTLVTALRDGHKQALEAGFKGVLKCDVVAAGQNRGAHNCGQCDARVVKYMKKFKDTQDPQWLDDCLERVQCDCRRQWQWSLELGELIPAYGDY